MQFTKEIINGKSMSATRVNQNRRAKILQRARDWLQICGRMSGGLDLVQNQNQNQT